MFVIKRNKLSFFLPFILFVFSAIYGLIMRWNFVYPFNNFNFKSVVEAHSHVAFLGWGFLTSILIILKLFIKNNLPFKSVYKITLNISTVSIFLLLISFIINGYGILSIVLLSVFGIASLVLIFQLLKDLNNEFYSEKFIRFGCYYYILSSIATWVIPIIIATQGKSVLYYNTVYFYLHFLYNGFFVFVLFGIFFKVLENQKININQKFQQQFFLYLNLACVPAYVLSILWSTTNLWINVIGFLAGLFQINSANYLFFILRKVFKQLRWSTFSKLLLKFLVAAYFLKVFMQLLSAFPIVIKTALGLKSFFIIGYLHLFTLGFLSVILILFLSQIQVLDFRKMISKTALFIFLLGILITETLLFSQGGMLYFFQTSIPNFSLILLIVTFLMVSGLIAFFISQFKILLFGKN